MSLISPTFGHTDGEVEIMELKFQSVRRPVPGFEGESAVELPRSPGRPNPFVPPATANHSMTFTGISVHLLVNGDHRRIPLPIAPADLLTLTLAIAWRNFSELILTGS